MRHIGILAHSADGAALCFLEAVRESARRLGPHEHPEITLSCQPMGPTLQAYDEGDLKFVRDHLAQSAQRLADAGCDFFVCPDNTAHIALETETNLPLPGLHIAEVVAQRAKTDGRHRIALLGTKWTMEGPVYPDALARAGLEMRVPDETDRQMVQRVIFDELCQGVISETARRAYVAVIERLRGDGCDAVALCCTEIPLLITPDVSPLPTLDSTRLLAHAAVSVSLGDAPAPSWRGGRVNT